MKILAISDATVPQLYDNFDKAKFADIDCVISCGDLPIYYLDFIIDALNVPCFFVPGNHDKALEEKHPAGWVNLHENVVNFRGLTIAGLGGSRFYNGESEFQYSESEMLLKYYMLRLKLLFKPKIDIFVSHSPSYGLGDLVDSTSHQGFRSFLKILDFYKPKLHLYGHTHLDYGVNRFGLYHQTLLINAFRNYSLSWDDVLTALQTKNLKDGVDGQLIEFKY